MGIKNVLLVVVLAIGLSLSLIGAVGHEISYWKHRGDEVGFKNDPSRYPDVLIAAVAVLFSPVAVWAMYEFGSTLWEGFQGR